MKALWTAWALRTRLVGWTRGEWGGQRPGKKAFLWTPGIWARSRAGMRGGLGGRDGRLGEMPESCRDGEVGALAGAGTPGVTLKEKEDVGLEGLAGGSGRDGTWPGAEADWWSVCPGSVLHAVHPFVPHGGSRTDELLSSPPVLEVAAEGESGQVTFSRSRSG